MASKAEDFVERVASQPGNSDPCALWPGILVGNLIPLLVLTH